MYENFKELYEKEKMRAEALEMDIIAHTIQIKALQDQVNNYGRWQTQTQKKFEKFVEENSATADVIAMTHHIKMLQAELNSYKNIMGHTDLNAVQPTKGGTS